MAEVEKLCCCAYIKFQDQDQTQFWEWFFPRNKFLKFHFDINNFIPQCISCQYDLAFAYIVQNFFRSNQICIFHQFGQERSRHDLLQRLGHQIGFNVVALVVTVSIFTWLVTGLALISADKVVLKCKKSEIEYLQLLYTMNTVTSLGFNLFFTGGYAKQ